MIALWKSRNLARRPTIIAVETFPGREMFRRPKREKYYQAAGKTNCCSLSRPDGNLAVYEERRSSLHHPHCLCRASAYILWEAGLRSFVRGVAEAIGSRGFHELAGCSALVRSLPCGSLPRNRKTHSRGAKSACAR